MSESKHHSWSRDELRIVCICYKEKLPIELALKLTNTTNTKSMQMRYQNCLFLDKGRVEDALSHPSKTLTEVWEEVKQMYPEEEVSEEELDPEPPVVRQTENNMCEAAFFAVLFAYVVGLLSFIGK
jgi:hypothetical protein